MLTFDQLRVGAGGGRGGCGVKTLSPTWQAGEGIQQPAQRLGEDLSPSDSPLTSKSCQTTSVMPNSHLPTSNSRPETSRSERN